MEIEKTIYANVLLYKIYNQTIRSKDLEYSNSLILSSFEKNTIFSNILKEGLEELILKQKYDIEIYSNLPSTLKYINMGNLFNKTIPINILPLNLIKLSFGKSFNQEFDINILPPKLEILELGESYNKKFKLNVLPQSLTHLSFSKNSLYNQIFEKDVLPKSLKYLSFNGHLFNTDSSHFLKKNTDSSKFLKKNTEFEYELCYQDLCTLQDDSTNDFNQIIGENILPQSLIYIKFGNRFNQKIDKNVLPNSLKYLIFGTWYNTEIDNDILPNTIEFLKFDVQFNKKINILPLSLKTLIFGKMFNQPINIGSLPNGLETLSLGTFFNQNLEVGLLPHSLKNLYFGLRFNRLLKNDVLPPNLLHLQICNSPFNDINLNLPQKLISVTIMKHNYIENDIDIFNLIPNLLYLNVYSIFDRFQCTYYINMPNMENNSLPMEICSNGNIIYIKKRYILESKKINKCAKELIDNIYITEKNFSKCINSSLFSGAHAKKNTKGNIIFEDIVKHVIHPSKIIKLLNDTCDAYNIDDYI